MTQSYRVFKMTASCNYIKQENHTFVHIFPVFCRRAVMKNKKDLYNNSKKEHRLGWKIIFTILVTALFLSIYTFILQNNYKKEFY